MVIGVTLVFIVQARRGGWLCERVADYGPALRSPYPYTTGLLVADGLRGHVLCDSGVRRPPAPRCGPRGV